MAKDTEGNDLSSVSVPVTGFIAVQLDGEPTFVEAAAGNASPLVLPVGYEKVGLFKVDGGPTDASEAEDPIEFFQSGYKLAAGMTRTVQVNLAEFNLLVQRLITGKTPDTNGMIVVDGNNDATFPIFEYRRYKGGKSLRRNGFARISAVEPDQNERNAVAGNAVTFEWMYQEDWEGFYRQWTVGFTDPVVPPETP